MIKEDFNIENGELLYYTGESQDIIIPNEVTSIGNSAFEGCENIKSVIIPEGVQKIGDYAFGYCRNLTSINIPKSVISIGNHAFSRCGSLINVSIPSTITLIDNFAFNVCKSLEYNIYDNACYLGNTEKPFLVLVKAIDQKIKSCEIHENTKIILDYAFGFCEDLTDITIPENVGSIGIAAFMDCKSLEKISIPNNVLYIGDNVFQGCVRIKSIVLPDGLSFIGNRSFYGCDSLTEISIPSKVVKIEYSAFELCRSLKNIIIPKNVQVIEYSVFDGCSNLGNIIVEEKNPRYDSRNNCNAVIETKTNALIIGCQKTIIPDNVKIISTGAFRNCDNLKSIIIPKSVENIEEKAFLNCNNLESIKVEENNPKYNSRRNCHAIIESKTNTIILGCKNTVIPNDITRIESYAFSFSDSASLIELNVPNSVTSIGYNAFSGTNKLICNLYNNAFYIGNNENPYLVLIQAKDVNIKNCEIYNGTRFINDHAFYGCKKITEISIPTTVTRIGEFAFSGCSALKNITVPDSVKEIGNYIFKCCDNLEGNLFDNAYYIGNNENPYFILIKAKDYDITNCEIHKNTAYIIEDAFRFCECLTELAMPDGLISIKGYAFMSCTQLKHIILPKSIKNIESHAFYHCNNIKKVYYTGTIKDLSNNPLSEYKFRPFNKLYYYSKKKPITKGKFWHYDEEMKSIIEW